MVMSYEEVEAIRLELLVKSFFRYRKMMEKYPHGNILERRFKRPKLTAHVMYIVNTIYSR